MQSPNLHEAKFASPNAHRDVFTGARVVLTEDNPSDGHEPIEQLKFQAGSQTRSPALHLSLIISPSTLQG